MGLYLGDKYKGSSINGSPQQKKKSSETNENAEKKEEKKNPKEFDSLGEYNIFQAVPEDEPKTYSGDKNFDYSLDDLDLKEPEAKGSSGGSSGPIKVNVDSQKTSSSAKPKKENEKVAIGFNNNKRNSKQKDTFEIEQGIPTTKKVMQAPIGKFIPIEVEEEDTSASRLINSDDNSSNDSGEISFSSFGGSGSSSGSSDTSGSFSMDSFGGSDSGMFNISGTDSFSDSEEEKRKEQEERERVEAERKAKEEAERKAKEEAERKAKEEAERKAREEAERKAREEAERKAKEEAERKAREKAEAERIAREKAEAERKAREKAEAERIAREKAEAERIAREKAEAERIAREKAEAERKAREKAEAERIAREKAEAERIAREKAEAERIAREKAEAERIAREKAEAERAAREKAEAERAIAEREKASSVVEKKRPVDEAELRDKQAEEERIKASETSDQEIGGLFEKDQTGGTRVFSDADMEKVQKLIDILNEAKRTNASDIHIASNGPTVLRIDGDLVEMRDMAYTPYEMDQLIRVMLTDKQLKELYEMGEFDFAYSLPGFARIRLNAFRQRGAYAMALRILSSDIPDPVKLGLPQSVIDLTKKRRGLVLVTGATGSGKSTTLAALIGLIARTYPKNIITLEDPIEYLHSNQKSIVTQREIGYDTMSYANGVRAALREDPDVILVGEMRDLETISTAITAAETGHLVFSTLHTNSAADTVDRVIDVFPPHQQQQVRVQFANVMLGIIAQQLLPKVGHGRIGAFEVLLANSAISNLIREGKSFQIPSTIQTSRKEGMVTMDDYIFDLFSKGIITEQTAVTFAHDSNDMSKRIHSY